MNSHQRPILLILTSSFPQSPDDETCGYIRDFARSLAADFKVEILAPPEPSAVAWADGQFTLFRTPSFRPVRLNRFVASRDLNDLARTGLIAKLISFISVALYFLAAIRQARKADIICSHWMVPSGLAGSVAALIFRKPHIVIEHSGGLHLLARIPGGRMLARFIVSRSNSLITVSSHLREKLLLLCPQAESKSEVISMGTGLCPDSGSEYKSDSSTKTALFIGRLVEIKGVDVLIRALRGMNDVKLIVAGDGEKLAELESLAATVSGRSEFTGRVKTEQKKRLLARCDFVVIPSLVLSDGREEGVPVVSLEALSAGRPVIASRSGGIPEVIIDGYNGLLFDAGDCAGLAAAIRRLIDEPGLYERLSINARLSADAYRWDDIGKRFSRSLLRALDENDQRIDYKREYNRG